VQGGAEAVSRKIRPFQAGGILFIKHPGIITACYKNSEVDAQSTLSETTCDIAFHSMGPSMLIDGKNEKLVRSRKESLLGTYFVLIL
jgi:hypothetical protein